MSKRHFFTILALAISLMVMAVPARRGIWRTLTLTDGTQVTAQLAGDEHTHYYRTADGGVYTFDTTSQCYVRSDLTTLIQRSAKRRAQASAARHKSPIARHAERDQAMTGTKRALIILAQFQDQPFANGNDLARYRSIANEEGHSEGRFRGSIRDYFKAQSNGQFVIDFDVAGPVTVSHDMAYYGGNKYNGDDLRPEEMVAEACRAVDDQVNFADYDWDGDGEVEQVFVIYAGLGEANGGAENTIWPHKYNLRYSGNDLTLDGVYIDTYACGAELAPVYEQNASGQYVYKGTDIDGIGTVCHEFSHCLGYPDTYDIYYSGNFGMGDWDLMCGGSYNGDGFCPAGYNAYEKMTAGWIQPEELAEEDRQIKRLQALSEGGGAYIIYNADHRDEYYLIENRQQTEWDSELPGAGMIVTHVDYDPACWLWNVVNTNITSNQITNDHQRLTIVHADNDDDSQYWNSSYGYTRTTQQGDAYPYNGNNRLTATSTPAATVYNAHADGSKLLGRGITDITQHDDGTISFNFLSQSQQTDTPVGEVFHETFDKCNGTGGNDGKWNGNIASSIFWSDHTAWISLAAYGGKQCARFGSNKVRGEVSSPAFDLVGKAILTFRAAPWSGDGTNLEVYVNNTRVASYEMVSGQWNDYSVEITGNGPCNVTFSPDKRFFLDDMRVYVPDPTPVHTIEAAPAPTADGRVYNLQGQYLGTDLNSLPHGIYVVNGKKVVK